MSGWLKLIAAVALVAELAAVTVVAVMAGSGRAGSGRATHCSGNVGTVLEISEIMD